MGFSAEARQGLDKLGVDNVRLKLQYAGSGRGALVPGLLDDNQLRGDVEDWLAERNRQSDKLQAETLWWAKATAARLEWWGQLSP